MGKSLSNCWYPLLASAGQCVCCFKLRDCPYVCAAEACIEIAKDKVTKCLKDLEHAQIHLAECKEELAAKQQWEGERVAN